MPKVYDLFAGVGGFRHGVAMARPDAEFVGWCENDPYAATAYEAVWRPAGERYLSDVWTATRSAPSADTDARIRDLVPAHDLLVAGFPCQPHSLMGNRRGLDDARGTLFDDIAAVARVMEPGTIIIENVRALRSVNGGQLFRQMLTVLGQDLGYNVRTWVLDAAHYGIPQVRRRLFVVASRSELPELPPPKVLPAARRWRSVHHLLEREVDARYYLSERILATILKNEHKGYKRPALINRLDARPLCKTMHKLHRASQDNYFSDDFVAGRYDEESGTVSMAPMALGGIRRPTPREAFRIQGFPEEMIERLLAAGLSDTRLYMLAGNAAPPPLVAAVVRHVLPPEVKRPTARATRRAAERVIAPPAA